MRLRKKKAGHNHEESEEGWLVSYADMMTLLVGFFAILLSFSKPDSKNFEKIKKSATKVFGGSYQVPFDKLSKKLKKMIKAQGLQKLVFFEETDEGLVITFKGNLFFDSGSATLKPSAKVLMEKVIDGIGKDGKLYEIRVEGHTDDVPINTRLFPSNWELSSMRACSVIRMFEQNGFLKELLRAQGFADTQPIVPNKTKKGRPIPLNRAQNRRVVIKIMNNIEL